MAGPAAGLNLAKIPPGARVGIGVGFVVLVALTYWVLFYTDVSTKITAARTQTAQLTNELASQRQAQASYFADRDELAMRQQRSRELNKVLPESTEQAAFLSSIQQVSNVSGVELKGWTPMDERTEAFFTKVPMRLEMTGRFHQIAKFAYEIGKLDRIINVENIQISDPKVDGDQVTVKAKCLATTFHMTSTGKKP
jgi:type IV pilus assembly protein PilO